MSRRIPLHSPAEIACAREAGRLAAEVLAMIAPHVQAGVSTVELERDLSVPVETEPAKRLLDLLGRLVHLACGVGVLDPQPELPTLVTSEEPVEQRGANIADVQETSRRGRHADTDGHGRVA